MKPVKNLLILLMTALTAVFSASPFAAAFPNKTVRIIVPWKAGGGSDTIARALANAMDQMTKESVIVENRTGGAGDRAHLYVKDAEADGHTLLLNASSELAGQLVFRKVPYDASDFTCIGGVYDSPQWILTHKDSGINNFDDFLAKARAAPGKLTIGTTSVFSPGSVLANAVLGNNDVKARIIPFMHGANLKKAILANQVSLAFLAAPLLLDAVQSGELNVVLSGSSLEGITYEPVRGTPTVSDYKTKISLDLTRGLFAPKNMAPETKKAVMAFVKKAAMSDAFKAFGERFGFTPVWIPGPKFCAQIAQEYADYSMIKIKFMDK